MCIDVSNSSSFCFSSHIPEKLERYVSSSSTRLFLQIGSAEEVISRIEDWERETEVFPASASEAQIKAVMGRVDTVFSRSFFKLAEALDETAVRPLLEERFPEVAILSPKKKIGAPLPTKQMQWTHAVAMEILLRRLEKGGDRAIQIEGSRPFQREVIESVRRLASTRTGQWILGAVLRAVYEEVDLKPLKIVAGSQGFAISPKKRTICYGGGLTWEVRRHPDGTRERLPIDARAKAVSLGHEMLHFLQLESPDHLLVSAKKIQETEKRLFSHYTNFAEVLVIEGHLFGYPSENILSREFALLERVSHCNGAHGGALSKETLLSTGGFLRYVVECITSKIHREIFLLTSLLVGAEKRRRLGAAAGSSELLLFLHRILESDCWSEAVEFVSEERLPKEELFTLLEEPILVELLLKETASFRENFFRKLFEAISEENWTDLMRYNFQPVAVALFSSLKNSVDNRSLKRLFPVVSFLEKAALVSHRSKRRFTDPREVSLAPRKKSHKTDEQIEQDSVE